MTPPTGPYPPDTYWTFHARETRGREPIEQRKRLFLEYEMPYSRITDNFGPDQRDADELLNEWLSTIDIANGHEEDMSRLGLGPGWLYIRWGVHSPDGNVAEHAPFQIVEPSPRDFLTYFTWPRHAETGEPINWLRVPVEDFRWDLEQADNGGFLQAATGWKPSPLQPAVHVSQFRGLHPSRGGGL
jgi:hypothetical protein